MDRKKEQLHEEAHRIDLHVGMRLRAARESRGLTQKDLGSQMGVAFQQIQKYEQGINRVSAGKLCQFCRVLHVPFFFFYQGLEEAEHLGRDYTLSGEALMMGRKLDALPDRASSQVQTLVDLLYDEMTEASGSNDNSESCSES